jgi:hypothetical protein
VSRPACTGCAAERYATRWAPRQALGARTGAYQLGIVTTAAGARAGIDLPFRADRARRVCVRRHSYAKGDEPCSRPTPTGASGQRDSHSPSPRLYLYGCPASRGGGLRQGVRVRRDRHRRGPQSDIAEALRVAIDEILNAAKSDDWEQAGRDLIAWARAFLEPAPSEEVATTLPKAALSPWPSLPDPDVARGRKRPVKVDQQAILAWMHERQPTATPREIAQHFDVSEHSAKCKADGLVAQGKLTVTPGSRSQRTPRRYSVPAVSGPEVSDTTDADGRRKLTDEQAKRRGLKAAYCEVCGFHPENRSQAIAHAAECGSIVATLH